MKNWKSTRANDTLLNEIPIFPSDERFILIFCLRKILYVFEAHESTNFDPNELFTKRLTLITCFVRCYQPIQSD